MLPHEHLTSRIIGAAFRAHNTLGPGHLEHVYRNALALLLQEEGLHCRVEAELPVHFQGVKVGLCEADLVVESVVVVETKAREGILPGHEARLGAYLRCSGHELGLLVNFGPVRVEVKRVVETRVGKRTG
ncbi:MAG: GxxExxY protein [Planctomycetia bacterium]|nr:GxxExxY protein [Planctomycetia bacterium]